MIEPTCQQRDLCLKSGVTCKNSPIYDRPSYLFDKEMIMTTHPMQWGRDKKENVNVAHNKSTDTQQP